MPGQTTGRSFAQAGVDYRDFNFIGFHSV